MRKYLFNILLIIFSTVSAQKSNGGFVYDYISQKEGLSHNYVTKIVSDSLNVKWIATENGITKYDGLNYTAIKPGEEYPGLRNENIETLYIDSKNNLWIGTKSGGLSKLEIETNKLTNYNYILDEDIQGALRIRVITEDKKGNIWIGSQDNGVFVLNDSQKKVVNRFKSLRAKSIIADEKDIVWIGSQNKLIKIDTSSDSIFTYTLDNYITTLIKDISRNCLWISTIDQEKNGNLNLSRFDLENEKLSTVTTNISSNYATSLYLDQDDRLWVGTWGSGLYYSSKNLKKFYKQDLVLPQREKEGYKYDIILDIHSDKNNVLWISSSNGGVKLMQNQGFKNITSTLDNPVLTKELNVNSVYKNENGIYLGTLRSGLFFGAKLNSLQQVNIENDQKVFRIYEHNDVIVFGTSASTVFMDKNQNEISKLDISKPTFFLSENDEYLWIGTQHNGLYLINVSNFKAPKIVKHYRLRGEEQKLESNRITSMAYDAVGNLWVGTYNGLHLYDRNTKNFVHHTKFMDTRIPQIINCIYANSGFIWLGTPNGLYKLKFKNEILEVEKTYTVVNGLINDFICGISSDRNNNLWISTSTNLVNLNPTKESLINYGEEDGIATSIFNLRSIYEGKNKSMIYVGGIDNLTYFNPDDIEDKQNPHELIFTALKVNNRRINAYDSINGRVLLNKNIGYADKIELTHREKSFSIGFINNNFSDQETISYRYRLLGYQKDWNYIKNQKNVNFVGLAPGNYEFQVSSSKDYKQWSDPKSLEINVLHAPWLSPLAYLIYVILFILIFLSFILVYLRQRHFRHKLELSEITQEKENDLNEAKLTFFTNISHEFRTPLTLVLGPLKEILGSEKLNGEIREKLITVEKNANRMLKLTNELIDFRKAQHGILKLNASKGNIVKFSLEVFMYFKEQAFNKNIDYRFESDRDLINLSFDHSKMEIVICNLISNALKYTKPGGRIIFKIIEKKDYCLLSIEDNGIGIAPEDQQKIFDRFYQIKNTNTAHVIGSGIGLTFSKKIIELHKGHITVESKINKGSHFNIKLPYAEEIKNYLKNNRAGNAKSVDTYKELSKGSISLDPDKKVHENTILIIDDNADIRKYLRSLLGNHYELIEAENGDKGIELASEHVPDLILCDIMMPGKDGLTVCKELKKQIGTSHIPVILLTARSSNIYEIKGLNTGADDFITKPFAPKIIKARIATVLHNRQKLRKYFLNKVRFEPSKNEINSEDAESIFIAKAVKLIEENLLDDNLIETLMDELCMSQSTLYRKIKSLTGLSLTGFIRSIRLKNAAEIILSKNLKLSQVALEVGFNDYKYFRESFKKQFGCLPSKYKKTIQKK
ncbi:hybrid sensor histidine kinase/response regulator transcription factor [Christiangramia crocea]|uniref:histidine kinase n=1 Tax=Christiangramia crocea TaxID=2904124 RepID=A0A9X1UYA8_9FLAO|nr:hybrid sensor histidine kinase/response regulator transcription factor [Gramella crocea]MCG9972537.1 response regulator [Gramella crocea]